MKSTYNWLVVYEDGTTEVWTAAYLSHFIPDLKDDTIAIIRQEQP